MPLSFSSLPELLSFPMFPPSWTLSMLDIWTMSLTLTDRVTKDQNHDSGQDSPFSRRWMPCAMCEKVNSFMSTTLNLCAQGSETIYFLQDNDRKILPRLEDNLYFRQGHDCGSYCSRRIWNFASRFRSSTARRDETSRSCTHRRHRRHFASPSSF